MANNRIANGNGDLRVEQVALADLKPHPCNYRSHPPKQVEHLVASQEEFGVYRNVVIAKDGTILAGHGVVEAARERGDETAPAVRMAFGPNGRKARKLMVLDNQVSRLAEDADDVLVELLKEIGDADDLLGTGYDPDELAALLTLPEGEEFDENLDLSKIKTVTCPECGHEFPI